MVLIKITAKDDSGRELVSRQQAYFMAGATHIFLSRECQEDLEVISEKFPKVGFCRDAAAVGGALSGAGATLRQHLASEWQGTGDQQGQVVP